MSVQYRSLDSIGFPGYRVGDDGSVWSCLRLVYTGYGNASRISPFWHRLKPCQCRKTRRLLVSLCVSGKRFVRHVHTLVLLAFVGPRPEGMEACHFPDRDPANNHLTNLRWDSIAANHADAVKHGTKGPGEKHPRATITDDIVLAIRAEARLCRGFRGWRAPLAKKYGISMRCLKHILGRTSWTHI